ncbi:MAG: hypothetical protein NTZ16_13570 [Verrucomicrobia bacterium]|nr:hypothetical protein [Verrucomicrobiota bacterium]
MIETTCPGQDNRPPALALAENLDLGLPLPVAWRRLKSPPGAAVTRNGDKPANECHRFFMETGYCSLAATTKAKTSCFTL